MTLRSISAMLIATATIAVGVASWGGLWAAAKRPHFTDIAPRSRIAYVTNNNYTGLKYFQQPMCGGVAILDFDNDGKMDIFFSNGAKLPELKKTDASFYNCLLRNKGDGTFEDVTAQAGIAGAVILAVRIGTPKETAAAVILPSGPHRDRGCLATPSSFGRKTPGSIPPMVVSARQSYPS